MNNFISKTGITDKTALINKEALQKKSTLKGDNTFDRILDQHVRKESAAESNSANKTGLSEIQSPVKMAVENPGFDSAGFTRQLDRSVGLLERYAAFLGDPDKSLKQAHEVLEQLMDQTRSLTETFEKSSEQDAGLKQMLAELTTTAAVEQIKFNRGDYSV